MMIEYLLWLALGLAGGWAYLLYATYGSVRRERQVYAVGLVVAAAIYVVFAFVWGDLMWVAVEMAGISAYGLFAWLALRHAYFWVALGWGLHPVWDVALHLFGPGHGVAPEWYAVACISFDLLVAGYVLHRIAHWQQKAVRA